MTSKPVPWVLKNLSCFLLPYPFPYSTTLPSIPSVPFSECLTIATTWLRNTSPRRLAVAAASSTPLPTTPTRELSMNKRGQDMKPHIISLSLQLLNFVDLNPRTIRLILRASTACFKIAIMVHRRRVAWVTEQSVEEESITRHTTRRHSWPLLAII